MINYLIGNIIDSPADCLVNTVNCEGFMGKGIAYQFKLKFPENEKTYQTACRKKEVQIGKILLFEEKGKLIANFPTKTEWRKNSEYSYIQSGMINLVDIILANNIKTIALPPLGCGNGGLEWHTVKEIIIKFLQPVEENTNISIYEPSKNYKTTPTKIPKLTASHLILLGIKNYLKKPSKLRLQKSAYFMCVFSRDDFFSFTEYNYGPYSHSIDICSRNIKEFQDYYNIDSLEAEKLAKNNLISDSVQKRLNKFTPQIIRAVEFVNSVPDDHILEIFATLVDIIRKQPGIDEEHIIERFYSWSAQKERYDKGSVINLLHVLVKIQIINRSLMGYELNSSVYNEQNRVNFQNF